MCKHVAAVLYGVGARLDQQPELLFSLRRVDAKDLVAQAGAVLQKSGKRPKAGKVLDDASLADVFGIEMAETPPPTKPAARRNKPAAAKVAAKKTAKPAATMTRKPPATAKTAVGKKTVTKKAPVQPSAGSRKATTGKVATRETKAASPPATPKSKTVTTKRASVRLAKDKSR